MDSSSEEIKRPSGAAAGLSVKSIVPPLTWSVFSWLFFVSLSERLSLPFYALVRDLGITPHTSSIVLFSDLTGRYLLVAGSCALLAVHAALLKGQAVRDTKALAWSLGFFASLLLDIAYGSLASILLLGLSSVAIVAFVDVLWMAKEMNVERGNILGGYALGVAGISAIIAIAASARWIANGFEGSQPLADSTWSLAFVGIQILGFLDPLLPQAILMFLLSWIIRLVISPSAAALGSWAKDREAIVGKSLAATLPVLSTRRWSLAMLGTAIASVVFVGTYAYLPAVNPSSVLVGVDVKQCYSNLLAGRPGEAGAACASDTWASQRIGALGVLQFLTILTGSSDITLKAMPALLGIFLVLSTYSLVLEGTGEAFVAGLSALLTAVSFQVVAGIDAGILANWMAISIAFVFLALLLRGMRKQRFEYLLAGYALLAALFFVHPWTFALTLAVLLVYLGVELVQSLLTRKIRAKKFEAVLLGTLLGAGLASEVFSNSIPIAKGLAVAYASVGPLRISNAYQTLTTLQQTSQTFLGGAMADPAWFLLGLVGVVSIPSLRGRFGKLLTIWLSMVLIGVALTPPRGTQARLIYDLPLQIFAAIGLSTILRQVCKPVDSDGASARRLSSAVAILSIVSVVGLLLGFALEYVGYVY